MNLRRLEWMATARRRHDWAQTAQICAVAWNAGQTEKKLAPDDFLPEDLRQVQSAECKVQSEEPRITLSMSALGPIFTGQPITGRVLGQGSP